MKIKYFLLILLFGLFSACDKEDDQPDLSPCGLNIQPDARFYEFAHESSDATYIAWTSDPDVISEVEAQLQLPEDQRGKHINGALAELPAGCDINAPWSWYFPPEDWALADASIEVCDGNPQYVEENLSEFTDNIGRYCPWGSYVSREIDNPF